MTAAEASTRARRRWLYLAGLALPLLALATYIVRLTLLRDLHVPRYLPYGSTLGFAMMTIATMRQRSRGRMIGLFFAAFLTAFSWGIVGLFHLPTYEGPEGGATLPEFQALFADGTPFSNTDIPGDAGSVLVFFRGHW